MKDNLTFFNEKVNEMTVEKLKDIAIELITEIKGEKFGEKSYIYAETVFRTINKHIEELKGENK